MEHSKIKVCRLCNFQIDEKYKKMNYCDLKTELKKESRNREKVELVNLKLESWVTECESVLSELEKSKVEENDTGNTWNIRYDNQVALNEHLRDETKLMERDFSEIMLRLTLQKDYRQIQMLTKTNCSEAMNFNLDALNEKELCRLLKQLESMQRDLHRTLRETNWKLDKTLNEFQNIDTIRQVYKTELEKVNLAIFHMRPPKEAMNYDLASSSEANGSPSSKGKKKKSKQGKEVETASSYETKITDSPQEVEKYIEKVGDSTKNSEFLDTSLALDNDEKIPENSIRSTL